MANELFGKQAIEELKRSNQERKEKNRVVIGDTKVRLIPNNPILKILGSFFGVGALGTLFLWLLGTGTYRLLSKTNTIQIFESLKHMISPIVGFLFIIMIVCSVLFIIIWLFWLRPPRFDRWLKDIAKKRLSCEYIFFTRHYLFIQYDVSLDKKDIEEFVAEISNKSELFTYYLDNIDINSYTISINIAKRKVLPKRCNINIKADTVWNFVPMGMAVNHELKDVTPIGWYINDNNDAEKVVDTLPSTSILIAGGTGSGKSVVENGIIGHITRHPDQIQAFLCDVKMVEFNGLEKYRGIHKVALTVPDVAEALEQMRQLMMDRFAFMKSMGVNNIYKLAGKTVHWYQIGDKKYQFDEIMQCTINGNRKLLAVEKIYEHIMNGDKVDIDDYALCD